MHPTNFQHLRKFSNALLPKSHQFTVKTRLFLDFHISSRNPNQNQLMYADFRQETPKAGEQDVFAKGTFSGK